MKGLSILKTSKKRVKYLSTYKGRIDGENLSLGTRDLSQSVFITLATDLGPSFHLSCSTERFTDLRLFLSAVENPPN